MSLGLGLWMYVWYPYLSRIWVSFVKVVKEASNDFRVTQIELLDTPSEATEQELDVWT